MEAFPTLEESLKGFERAAAKGHEESVWIVSVVNGVGATKGAFARTDHPLGWYLAGKLANGLEEFDLFKKSAEGGCSWGQVKYGEYFKYCTASLVDKEMKMYVEWMEKAVNQNNPLAMCCLAVWFREEERNMEKAYCLYGRAAELGWKRAMRCLFVRAEKSNDFRQSVVWAAKSLCGPFWTLQRDLMMAEEQEERPEDFDQHCYSLGWGLYWYQHGTGNWRNQQEERQAFGNRCLDYYCSCVEVLQKSIFTFLLCWKQWLRVKDVGGMSGKMVWEEREENLVKEFGGE
jgi:TPR repeat protein